MKKVINYRFIVSGTAFTAPEYQGLFLQAALPDDGGHLTTSKVIQFYLNEEESGGDEEGVNKFTCKCCGAKADSKTLYVMDREECRKPEG